jgi:hypothetical protein
MPVFALVLARSDGKFGPQFRRSEVDGAAIFSAVCSPQFKSNLD